jgi:hypothetical protein
MSGSPDQHDLPDSDSDIRQRRSNRGPYRGPCRTSPSLSLSDVPVGFLPGPPPRPPHVLARLHAETARRQALRLAPRHDHLTPFTVDQGLKVRVGTAPLAAPAGHPSHVFPGNCHHFHPEPHCSAVSNLLKIWAVYGKSIGSAPRDSGGQAGSSASRNGRPQLPFLIPKKEEHDGRATESRRGQS